MSDEHKGPTAIVEHREPRQSMSPLVEQGMAILRNCPDPATLRELLEVQRVWEEGEARKAFSLAMVQLKVQLPSVIHRDATVSFPGTFYKHASLAGVLDAVREPLNAHGFHLSWRTESQPDGKVKVTAKLEHEAGHEVETSLIAPPDVSGKKNPAQAVMSTVTMLERYTALALLGIATADMKEPEGAEPPDPDSDATIDSKRNLAAGGWLKGKGKSVAEAAKHLGKPIERWTQADRNALRKWAEAVPSDD